MASDFQKTSNYAEQNLNLYTNDLGHEYFYTSLPLCIIDAVFSIGVNYLSTKNTVDRYCSFFNLPQFSLIRENFEKFEKPPLDMVSYPNKSEQEAVSDFVDKFSKYSPSTFAIEIFQNQQRTSTHNGLLKAEAVYEFALVLQRNRINYFQDLVLCKNLDVVENELRCIKGQGSGISTKYFWMLSGNKNQIKPDRMICWFVETAIGRAVSIEEAESIVLGAYDILKNQHKTLNLRLLDYKIWSFQRAEEEKKKLLRKSKTDAVTKKMIKLLKTDSNV